MNRSKKLTKIIGILMIAILAIGILSSCGKPNLEKIQKSNEELTESMDNMKKNLMLDSLTLKDNQIDMVFKVKAELNKDQIKNVQPTVEKGLKTMDKSMVKWINSLENKYEVKGIEVKYTVKSANDLEIAHQVYKGGKEEK